MRLPGLIVLAAEPPPVLFSRTEATSKKGSRAGGVCDHSEPIVAKAAIHNMPFVGRCLILPCGSGSVIKFDSGLFLQQSENDFDRVQADFINGVSANRETSSFTTNLIDGHPGRFYLFAKRWSHETSRVGYCIDCESACVCSGSAKESKISIYCVP